jgi:hypothetical protein
MDVLPVLFLSVSSHLAFPLLFQSRFPTSEPTALGLLHDVLSLTQPLLLLYQSLESTVCSMLVLPIHSSTSYLIHSLSQTVAFDQSFFYFSVYPLRKINTFRLPCIIIGQLNLSELEMVQLFISWSPRCEVYHCSFGCRWNESSG